MHDTPTRVEVSEANEANEANELGENGPGRYRNTVSNGRHTLLADEPTGAGGGDAGPTPYEFLLAALGSCTSMTLRMYAERKGLPLARVSVELTHQKVDVEDDLGSAGSVDTGRAQRVDRIERLITLDGELSAEQRARLLEIANKCPVYRTLTSTIEIDSRLTEACPPQASAPLAGGSGRRSSARR